MYVEATEIHADMDPRLQRALDRRRRGLRTLATASSGSDEIGVIAKVRNLAAWEGRGDVRQGAVLGRTENGAWLVTARIPIARIEAVRTAEVVESLKAAQPLRQLLRATLPDLNAAPDLLPVDARSAGGEGTVVGIVDLGGDFAHRNFRREDGTTRLIGLWDQNGDETPDSPFGYGRLHGAGEIDAALQTADPYRTLGYGPAPDSLFDHGSHGTHVMDIAAGNGLGSGASGVAPRALLAFVEPAFSDVAWEGEDVVDSRFGDSVQLLEALRFLFDLAGERPCVVNVSLGTNGGPHDGSSLVEQGIDALIAERPNRAVVIAASNSFNDHIHAAGDLTQGGTADLRWSLPATRGAQSELEVWYAGADRFGVEILQPDGTSLGLVALGSNARVQAEDGTTLLFVSHRATDPNNGDNVVGIFMEDRVARGTWTVRLHGEHVVDGHYHAWIERNDRSQSAFAEPHDDTHTLGSISCGRRSLVVGSYDAHKPNKPLSWFSSCGPTRDGRHKPDLSAPGHDVVAARSRSGTGVTRKSGTSMAAPAVTGVVALLLAEADALGLELDADALRELLIASGHGDPPPAGAGWHGQYGSARLDAAAALLALRARSPEGPVLHA